MITRWNTTSPKEVSSNPIYKWFILLLTTHGILFSYSWNSDISIFVLLHMLYLPYETENSLKAKPKCHPLRSASSPPSPAPCLSSRLAHSLCTMGSVCSHLPTLASLFQACVRNCLLRAIWQLTSATSFQLRPPPFLGGFHKTMLTSTQTFPRAWLCTQNFPHSRTTTSAPTLTWIAEVKLWFSWGHTGQCPSMYSVPSSMNISWVNITL